MDSAIHTIAELSDPSMPIFYTGKILKEYTSPVQTWTVVSTNNGECLFINNQLQSNNRDEALYHEYMVHSLLSGIKSPKNVLVLGGGEGCIIREVLKWATIENVTMVDWDESLCKYFMNEGRHWNDGAYHDSRVNVIYMDALEYVFSCKEKYDAIYIDLLDPVDGNMSYLTQVINYAKQCLLPTGGLIINAGNVQKGVGTPACDLAEFLTNKFKDPPYFRCAIKVYVPSYMDEWCFLFVAGKLWPLNSIDNSLPPLTYFTREELIESMKWDDDYPMVLQEFWKPIKKLSDISNDYNGKYGC